jgi:TonB family protein
LILAIYWYSPYTHSQSEEQISNVRVVQVVRRTPAPPQTPAPKPLQTAHPIVSKSHSHIALPHVTSRGGKNAGRPPAVVPPTPRPIATSSISTAGCVRPNATPGVSATPDVADIAAAARASHVSGIAAIDVSLDPAGNVRDAKVARSTGNDGLDASAMAMARNASYTPQYVRCKGIAATYMFTVRFVAW